jgi:hypothetical protein
VAPLIFPRKNCNFKKLFNTLRYPLKIFDSRRDNEKEIKFYTEDAIELFTEIEKMRNASSPIPVIISDDWDAFEEGLVNVYGKTELHQYKGTENGSKELQRWRKK